MEEKNYDLNIKRVVKKIIILTIIFCGFLMGYILIENNETFKDSMTKTLLFSEEPMYAIYPKAMFMVGAIITILYDLYLIILLLYRRKKVLSISENKIIYYSPDYGKLEISNEQIENIMFSNNQLKLDFGKKKLKKKLSYIILGFIRSLWEFRSFSEVFIINLDYIKCDPNEVLKKTLECGLGKGSKEAVDIINKTLETNNCKEIKQLSKESLEKLVIDLYNSEKLTQYKIAILTGISANKVSNLIKKEK